MGWKSLAALTDLGARLLRYNVAAFRVLEDGSRVAVARDGLYRAGPDEVQMTRVFRITRGSRPLNFGVDGSRLLFGEYGDDYSNMEVHLYVSEDWGRTFEVCHTFPRGSIRHVHNVIYDPYQNHYWVFVGDFDEQPGIGVLSRDLKNLEWVRRGDQKSRVVQAIIKQDCMFYGTDSEVERDYIIRMEKHSGRIDIIREVEGSCLYAAAFGPTLAISTCVEPSPHRTTRECAIYLSRDGDNWQKTFIHRKDLHYPNLFQYGTLVLPYCYCQQPFGMFSGQAVVGAHNRVTLLNFGDHEAI
jgi:hypothetical protein